MSGSTPGDAQIDALRSRMSGGDPEAFVSLARALSERGEHGEASEVAHQGLLSRPDSIEGRLVLAAAEDRQGRVREAMDQIKRALLIDPDHVEALVLMGRILVERGMSDRALQFLTHAAEKDPNHPAVSALRERARASTVGTFPAQRPGKDAQGAPSPWGEEHTVLAAATGQPTPSLGLQGLDAKLAALPAAQGASDASLEPTQTGEGGSEGSTSAAAMSPTEAPTQFAASGSPPIPPRRGKLGGSAAELSQVMRASLEPDPVEVRSPTPLQPAPEVGADLQTERAVLGRMIPLPAESASADASSSSVPAAEAAASSASADASSSSVPALSRPAVSPAAGLSSSSLPAVSPSAAGLSSSSLPAGSLSAAPSASSSATGAGPGTSKPALSPGGAGEVGRSGEHPLFELGASRRPGSSTLGVDPVQKPEAPSGPRAVGRVSTRMVDEALFALLGRRRGESESPVDGEPAPRRVVRTSAGFATWTQVALGVLVAAAALGLGYVVAVTPSGSAPEVVAEELSNLAAELDRGGLAALFAAEEHTEELRRGNPELAPLLAGVTAEVHARRFARFGAHPEDRTAARAALSRTDRDRPTVEALTAEVLVSTSAADLNRLEIQLARAARRHPHSPKVRVSQARVAQRLGHEEAALSLLTEARSLNPDHRQAELDTARALARAGMARMSLELYTHLQTRNDLDVEVAIERYLLGWASAQDPEHDGAVATLAGLVREERPEVAKDEAGRAALAFAVARLRDARVQPGLTALGEAEGAFANSALYQRTVGRMLLALGEGGRAADRFARAVELEPDDGALRRDLGRARYLTGKGPRLELEDLRKRLARLQRGAPVGELHLPYGLVRARPTRFELLDVELDLSVFPEEELDAAARAIAHGAEPAAATEAAVALALADDALRAGRSVDARKHFEAAQDSLPLAYSGWVEGRLLVAERKHEAAAVRFGAAIEAGAGGLSAVLERARALAVAGDGLAALEAYEAFRDAGGRSPRALVEEAQLRLARRDDAGAMSTLDLLSALEPDHAGGPVLRAEVLFRQERPEEAKTEVKAALRLYPKLASGRAPSGVKRLHPSVLTELGGLLIGSDRKRALALLKRAVDAEGAPPEAHFLLGKALVGRKRTRREGRKELARYLALAPEGKFAKEATKLSRRKR